MDVDKLIEDHWKYIEGILKAGGKHYPNEIAEIGYHYRTSGKHFWKHCMEHYNIKEEVDVKETNNRDKPVNGCCLPFLW